MHSILEKSVNVKIDRKLGSTHPKYSNMIYPVNYGYIPEVFAGDGEEQDAYVLGVDIPVDEFEGIVIAIIHRTDDNEDKWVVAPEGMSFSEKEILDAVHFTEQYFNVEVIMTRKG